MEIRPNTTALYYAIQPFCLARGPAVIDEP